MSDACVGEHVMATDSSMTRWKPLEVYSDVVQSIMPPAQSIWIEKISAC